MNTANMKQSPKEETYSVRATFKTESREYCNIPCKVFLPERIYEKPYFLIGPIKEHDKKLIKDFKGIFKADFRNTIGRKEPRTFLESPEVYFSSGLTKYNNESGPIRTMKGEPQNLHIITNIENSGQKSDTNHLTFWISPNSFLTPFTSRESSFSGEIKYDIVKPIDFTIKNSLKLSFEKQFKTKDLDNGDLLQWSFLIAKTEVAITVKDAEALRKKLLPDIDDFLLLVSFASRHRTSCLGWSGYDDSCITKFYRGNYVFPDIDKNQARQGGLIDMVKFKEFIDKCYPIFLRYPNKPSFRNALHSIIPIKSHTLEASFLRIFAGLETLVLDFRRKEDLEYIVAEEKDWSKLRQYLQKCIKASTKPQLSKEQRVLIYPKLGELNRVSIREAFERFSEMYSLNHEDLWPVFGNNKTIGLVDIRNKLIHGDPFSKSVFDALVVALEHLKIIFERMILSVLEWDVEESFISPQYLKTNYTSIRDFQTCMNEIHGFIKMESSTLHLKKHQERSYEIIRPEDLKKALHLARSDIESFFKRNPKYEKEYKGEEALIVIAQGGALHYLNQVNGVKDFDVWFFYPKKELTLPYRRRGVVDFGKSKFGRHPDDEGFIGRRVDVLMRSNKSFNQKYPIKGLIKYLKFGETKTAKLLSKKPVIGLWPEDVFGKVLWPQTETQ